ncbi:MAG: hypothetical protein JW894_13750 [Bacteroidales bacterium]|nr:hypothetical protein [Bacteroidales bacterium]
MRVFILCTGRSGSLAIIKACNHITNYTSGHESLAKEFGPSRLSYPDNHIEADNRLTWFLARMEKKFGDDPIYIHLKRNKEDTINSLNRRWHSRSNITRAYAEGILKTPREKLNNEQRLKICEDYYNTVNDRIEVFLKNKTKKMIINIENISEDFIQFWKFIEAKGDHKKALKEFTQSHNKSKKRPGKSTPYELKLFLLRIWRKFSK